MSTRIFIGWDTRFPEPAMVLAHTLRKHTRMRLDIRFLDKNHLFDCYGFERHQPDPLASTEFTYSRFLVPWLCSYEGLAAFMDNDALCLGDVVDLFAHPMEGLALRCVHHDYQPTATTKMAGAVQTVYPRKNYSSVMLMDCSKLKCWTKEVVETASGARLHRFQDIPDELIGKLDPAWNVLDKMPEDKPTYLLHMTSGGPWNHPDWKEKLARGDAKEFAGYSHLDLWLKAYQEWLVEEGCT